jgi:hypothetical protein
MWTLGTWDALIFIRLVAVMVALQQQQLLLLA